MEGAQHMAPPPPPRWRRHLPALLRKQVALARRNPRATHVELLLPLVFFAAMGGLYSAFPLAWVPPAEFSSPSSDVAVTVPPLTILPARLAAAKQSLCVAPSSPDLAVHADALARWLEDEHPRFAAGAVAFPPSASARLRSLVLPPLSAVLRRFPSEAAVEAHVRGDDYGDDGTKLFACIVVKRGPPHWAYAIRMNSSEVPDTNGPQVDVLSPAGEPLDSVQYALPFPSFGDNLSEQTPADPMLAFRLPGFAALQLAVDRFIINSTAPPSLSPLLTTTPPSSPSAPFDPESLAATFATSLATLNPALAADFTAAVAALAAAAGSGVAPANTTAALRLANITASLASFLRAERFAPQQVRWIPFPVAGHYTSAFYDVALTVLALFLVLAYLLPVSRLIRGQVTEKELRLREGLLMMGADEASVSLSWILPYLVKFAIIAAGAAGIASATFYPKSDGGLVFLVLLLFGFSAAAWGYLVSVFFSRAKSAASIGTLSFFALAFPHFGVGGSTASAAAKLGASICAPTAFSLTVDLLATVESNGQGVTFANAGQVVGNYSASWGLGWLAIDTLAYLVLGWYLGAVLPPPFREYGTARPWTFVFERSFWEGRVAFFRSLCGCGPGRRGAAQTSPLRSLPPSPAAPVFTTTSPPLPSAPNPFVEALDGELDARLRSGRCVAVRGLRKEFPAPSQGLGAGGLLGFLSGGGGGGGGGGSEAPARTKVAVAGLDLDLFEGQIFALLGHNGAGKTTTISMLTGLLPMSGGGATVFGSDLRDGMEELRRQLGVCPQHDVLWPDLTVKEHLRLFADIKQVPHAEVAAAVEKSIAEVGLAEKADTVAASLSGGQKRKLCVAIALLGGSKVVFLDEPTSGMDPYSRRSTWQMIQQAREGRVIVLTTHFLDEADILGDRIGIMAGGALACCGSPLYLKQRFGAGYTLTCARKAGADGVGGRGSAAAVLAVAQSHVPDARLVSDVGAEIAVSLPLGGASLAPLFGELEARTDELGLASLAISVVTIEDVFLKFAREGGGGGGEEGQRHASSSPAGGGNGGGSGSNDDDDDETVKDPPSAVSSPRPRGGAAADFLAHTRALLLKRASIALRDRRTLLCSLLLPVVAIICGCGLIQLAIPSDNPPYTLSTAQFNSGGDDAVGGRPTLFPSLAFKVGAALPANWTSDPAKSTLAVAADLRTRVFACIPRANVSSSSPVVSEAEAKGAPDPNGFVASLTNLDAAAAGDPYLEAFSAWLLDDRGNGRRGPESTYGAVAFTRAGSSVPGQDEARLWPVAGENRTLVATFAVYHNATARHAAPVFTNLLHSALYAAAQGDLCSAGGGGAPAAPVVVGHSITTTSHPLPFSTRQSRLLASYLSGSAATIIMIALAIVPASFAAYVVREKEVGAKHMQLISGVSIGAYWLSLFVFDVLSALVPAALTIIILAVFDVRDFISADGHRIHALVALFGLYAAALPGSIHLLSFLFTSHTSAQNAALMSNLLVVLFMIASMIMGQALGAAGPCVADSGLRYVYRLLPGWCLGNGLYTLSFLDLQPSLNAKCKVAGGGAVDLSALTPVDALDWKGTGTNIAYLAVEAVVYPLLAVLLDVVATYPAVRVRAAAAVRSLLPGRCGRAVAAAAFADEGQQADAGAVAAGSTSPAPDADDDPDVAAEAARVLGAGGAEATTDGGRDVIRVLGLRKVYPGKTAVHRLSFAVERGQVFGFLGVNGAGKSTTMKILTGDALPTAGTAVLGGFDVVRQQADVRRTIGYCPQHEALLDLLTCREHLQLYARIKGVPEGEVPGTVDSKLAALGIAEFADKPAGTLSGGTKRKLSVAIAMIGAPPLLFLDEPSTGMDPASRRGLWRALARAAGRERSCSILLTTHSMEEVEALCTRIGIMVGGRLRCLGNATHLRSRFGKGFDVGVKLAPPRPEVLEQRAAAAAAAAAAASASPAARGDGDGASPSTVLVVNAAGAASPTVRFGDLPAVCAALGCPGRAAEVAEMGVGWALHAAFRRSPLPSLTAPIEEKRVPVLDVARWVVDDDAVEAVVRFVTESFPGSSLLERQGSVLRFRVRVGDRGAASETKGLSLMFGLLEGVKDRLGLASFTVSHSSLEAVFNLFASGAAEGGKGKGSEGGRGGGGGGGRPALRGQRGCTH
jgi:ATP-binding cassette, subfamily A (ABC1), member 3